MNKMNKMTRYYTCPIKSLYMMEEFGVKFTNSHQIIESVENIWKFGSKENYVNFYVAKESEEIFKTKDDDLILSDDGESFYAEDVDREVGFTLDWEPVYEKNPYSVNCKIIMRDNKQFFMPEVEK